MSVCPFVTFSTSSSVIRVQQLKTRNGINNMSISTRCLVLSLMHGPFEMMKIMPRARCYQKSCPPPVPPPATVPQQMPALVGACTRRPGHRKATKLRDMSVLVGHCNLTVTGVRCIRPTVSPRCMRAPAVGDKIRSVVADGDINVAV
jgi:hypothetical protein